MQSEVTKSDSRPVRPVEMGKLSEDYLAERAVTNLVAALSVIDARDITPHLMCLLEELSRIVRRDQFIEVLEELLFTIALLKQGF